MHSTLYIHCCLKKGFSIYLVSLHKGISTVINMHGSLLSMFGRLVLTLRNTGDLLHQTICLTVSDLPAVQASFTPERRHGNRKRRNITQWRWVKALKNTFRNDDKAQLIYIFHTCTFIYTWDIIHIVDINSSVYCISYRLHIINNINIWLYSCCDNQTLGITTLCHSDWIQGVMAYW